MLSLNKIPSALWGFPSYLLDFIIRALGLRTIQRYVLREFLISFTVAFSFFFFIFLINQVLLIARNLLIANLPLGAIMLILLYSLPAVVFLSFPFGTLVGMLMAIAHLSATNQIIGIRSLGFSIGTIFRPLLVLSVILAVGAFFFNDYYLPLGLIRSQKLRTSLISNYPTVLLDAYSVKGFRTKRGKTYLITSAVDGDDISNLLIVDRNTNGERRTFVANKALVDSDRRPGVVNIILQGIIGIVAGQRNIEKYEYLNADEIDYNILLRDVTATLSLTPNELQLVDIYAGIQEIEENLQPFKENFETRIKGYRYDLSSAYNGFSNTKDRSIDLQQLDRVFNLSVSSGNKFWDNNLQNYRIEFFQRLAVPLASIPFVILAFSLGMTARRFGRPFGFLIGLLFSVFYWISLTMGKLLGIRLNISAFLSMFAANIILLVIGTVLYLILKER